MAIAIPCGETNGLPTKGLNVSTWDTDGALTFDELPQRTETLLEIALKDRSEPTRAALQGSCTALVADHLGSFDLMRARNGSGQKVSKSLGNVLVTVRRDMGVVDVEVLVSVQDP